MTEIVVIVVMGVSGSGKSTVGALLAERLGWDFADGDDFHPPANIAKMSAGLPLTDGERLPWLKSIADWIGGRLTTGSPAVVTCSALKRSYRELVSGGRPGIRQVLLDEDRDLIARRLGDRHGHFFRPELLDSQFRDLEQPGPDENVLLVQNAGQPAETVTVIASELGLQVSGDPHH